MDFSQHVQGNALSLHNNISINMDELAGFLERNKSITVLSLRNCNIDSEDIKALSEALKSGKLSHLTSLSLNLNDMELKALAESEKHCELVDKLDGRLSEFFKHLKNVWHEKRASSKGNVNKLDEDTTKKLFFDIARQGYPGICIKHLLRDSDKYPFLVNSRDEQGHTLFHFYNHIRQVQKDLFEHGLIPEQEEYILQNISQDRQSTHARPLVEQTNFITRKLVESIKVNKDELQEAVNSYVENIPKLFDQYQTNQVKIGLLNLFESEKRSVMEVVLSADQPVPNDKEFIEKIFRKAKKTLEQQYLERNGRYNGYSTTELQYDYTREDAKVTIPESVGYIKLLIDNFSIPLEEKKELLATLMEQNPHLVKEKLPAVKRELGNSRIFDKKQFNKTELHELLNDISDNKKVNDLFKEISNLDIEEVWREQKEFVLLKQIYKAATTYAENSTACTQGTWSQIIQSVSEIDVKLVDQYLERKTQEERVDIITEKNIKPFVKNLAEELIQYSEDNPKLKEIVLGFAEGNTNIDNPEQITLEEQKVFSIINKKICSAIKRYLPNYSRDIPIKDEYKIIINTFPEIKVMESFSRNYDNNQIKETETKQTTSSVSSRISSSTQSSIYQERKDQVER